MSENDAEIDPNFVERERILLSLLKGENFKDSYRELEPATLSKFGVTRLGNQIIYPYHKYGEAKLTSQKVRTKTATGTKIFPWRMRDDEIGLYGSNLFSAGGRTITITEGENDAMAVWQMNGDYPVVSIKDGAGSAGNLSEKDHEYLSSFESIVVCFDNDEQGKKATDKFCGIFPGKCKVVQLPNDIKDAHDMLVADRKKEFRNLWFNAIPFMAKNIVYPIDILDSIVDPPSYEIIPYPWEQLNNQIFGLHFPEVIVIKAKPKIGKSLITAYIEQHILNSTPYKVADITVENTPEERARTLLSVQMRKPLHLRLAGEDIGVSKEDIKEAGKEMFGDRRLILFEKNGITDSRIIVDKVQYFVSVLGCKFVVFDHINYLGAYHESDERKSIDEVSNRLADLAKDMRFCLIIVSHVNDEGKTFGSRNLVKAGYTVIDLDRDKDNADPYIRNLTRVKVTDSRRYGSRIGQPIYLQYDEPTYSLRELDYELVKTTLENSELDNE